MTKVITSKDCGNITKSRNGISNAFCDVYEFGNTKGTLVKEITSYVIEIARK